MPITPLHPVLRISQEEFRDLAYAVMGKIFEIHNEFGRLCDELIYKRELAWRLSEVELEFPITASHREFSHTYFLDALIANSGAFEFKAVDALTAHHRRQLYNYLILLDLPHGKLVNLRPENVEHEFVNSNVRPSDRFQFKIDADRWDWSLSGSEFIFESTIALLQDWGAGLEIGLYEAAITDFLGGEQKIIREVAIRSAGRIVGNQRMRLAEDGVAFRLTGFDFENKSYADHAARLLRHVELQAILWININLQRATFVTLRR